MNAREDIRLAAARLYRAAHIEFDVETEVALMDGSARRDLEAIVITALGADPAAVTDVALSVLLGAVDGSSGGERHVRALDDFRTNGTRRLPTGLHAFLDHAGKPSRWGDSYAAATLADDRAALFRILVQVEMGRANGRAARAPRNLPVRVDKTFGRGAAEDEELRRVAEQAVGAAVAYLRTRAPGRPVDGLDQATAVRVFRCGLPWPLTPDGRVPTGFHYEQDQERHHGPSMGLPIALAMIHAFLPQWTTRAGPICAATGELTAEGEVEKIGMLEEKARAAEAARVPFLYPRRGSTLPVHARFRQTAVDDLEDAVPEAFNLAGEDVGKFLALGADSLYGREAERRVLEAAWEDARRGDGRMVVVAGPSGGGKSGLVAAFVRELLGRHTPVLFESGLSTATMMSRVVQRLVMGESLDDLRLDARDYGAWLGTFDRDLARFLPDYYSVPGTPPDDETLRQRRAVATTLLRRGAAKAGALVIVLDDFQMSTELTWAILETAFRSGQGGLPILVLATYRNEPPSPQTDAAIARLRATHAVVDIALHGLDEASVLEWVSETARALLPGRPDAIRPLTRALWNATEGSPLELRIHLNDLATGASHLEDFLGDLDRIRRDNEEQKAASFRARLVRHRAFRVLGLASVFRSPAFTVPVIHDSFRTPNSGEELAEAEVLEQLDAAEQDGLLRVVARGRYAFTHDWIRTRVLEALPQGATAQNHRRVAEALERRALARGDEPPIDDLAVHYSEAAPYGNEETGRKAVLYATRAAEGKTAALQYGLARDFRVRALESFEAAALGAPAERARLLLETARAYSYVGGLEPEAREYFRQAYEAADDHGLTDLAVEAVVGFAGPPEDKGRLDVELLEILEAATKLPLPATDPRRVWVTGRQTFELVLAARRDPEGYPMPPITQIVAEARASNDPMRLAWALMAALIGNWLYRERTTNRLALADETLAVATGCGEKDIAAWAHGFRTIHLLELGRRDEAERAVDAMESIAEEVHHGYARWGAHALRPMFAYLDGRFDTSRKLAAEAADMRASPATTVYVTIQTMLALREEGRAGEIEPLIATARSILAPAWSASNTTESMALDAAWSALSCDLGALDGARRVLDGFASGHLFETADAWVMTTTLSLLAEASAVLGDARLAPASYDLLQVRAGETVVIALGIACLGATDRALGILAGLQGRWSEAEAHFAVALGINRDRLRSPVMAAHTQLDLATMLDHRRASGDAERARALCAEAMATAGSLPLVRVRRRAADLLSRLGEG